MFSLVGLVVAFSSVQLKEDEGLFAKFLDRFHIVEEQESFAEFVANREYLSKVKSGQMNPVTWYASSAATEPPYHVCTRHFSRRATSALAVLSARTTAIPSTGVFLATAPASSDATAVSAMARREPP